MPNRAGANQNQVDVSQASRKMATTLDGGREIPVLPECPGAALSVVVLSRHTARHKLQALRYLSSSLIVNQEVNVIRRDDVVQHGETEALARLE